MQYNIDITELWEHNFDKIDTPDGFQKINTLVKKPNKQCYSCIFSNNIIVECSEDHLFQTDTLDWISVKDIKYNQNILARNEIVRFVYKIDIGIQDTYDLEVDHINHRYYANDISSHNTGKTSTATALIKEIGGEALFINASMDNGIDLLRNQITNFAGTESFDGILKIVVLDEVDNLSPAAQFAFRSLIEQFASNCRFILTGNYKEKMLVPLLDRLENYDFNTFDKAELGKPIFQRLSQILDNENVTFTQQDLVPIINTYYPSIRSMIGVLQKYSTTGTLVVSINELDNQNEYNKLIEFVKNNDFSNMINAVNEISAPDNMYTYMYKHITMFEANKMPGVIMIIAKYQHQAGSVRDKNLNLAACLTDLMKL